MTTTRTVNRRRFLEAGQAHVDAGYQHQTPDCVHDRRFCDDCERAAEWAASKAELRRMDREDG